MNSSNSLPASRSMADLGLRPIYDRSYEPTSNGDRDAEIDSSIIEKQELIENIASLGDALAKKKQLANFLQEKLVKYLRREEELIVNISSMVNRNRELVATAASLAQEVKVLCAMHADPLKDDIKVTVENQSLNAVRIDFNCDLSVMERSLEGAHATVISAQAGIFLACFEIEWLKLEREEHYKEILMLHAIDVADDSQKTYLPEEKKALPHELEAIALAKTLEVQKVSDLQASIVALNVQLLTEPCDRLRDQVVLAEERLSPLDNINCTMNSQERDILTIIKNLEDQSRGIRTSFDTGCQGLGQVEVKVDNSRAFQVGQMEEAAAGTEHNRLNLSSKMQEKDTESRTQHVEELDSRVAGLRGQVEALVQSSEGLDAILRQQQETNKMESAQLREDVKTLVCCENKAEDRTQVLQGEEARSMFKLQELTISSNKKRRLSGLSAPLLISGSTIVFMGLLVFILHRRAKAN